MKIKISARMPDEERAYRDLKAYIEACYPGAKIRESIARPPHKVLFVTTKKDKRH